MHGSEGVLGQSVDQIVGFLSDRISVHLVGPHGSGRTTLVGLVADRMDDLGWKVFRLFGIPAWQREPFAALAAAGVVSPGGTPATRLTVAEVAKALTSQVRGANVVVVVDDADDLDAASVGALLHANRTHSIIVLLSGLSHSPVRRESLEFGLFPLAHVEMPMLDMAQVHQLCVAILGSAVEPGTLARITAESGGLFGVVRALASTGPRAGVLTKADGVWAADGDLWTPQLASTLSPLLEGLDRDLLLAAVRLAEAGACTIDEAVNVSDEMTLERLHASGILRRSGHGRDTLVGIFPPLLAHHLRSMGGGWTSEPWSGDSREGASFEPTDVIDPFIGPSFRAAGADAAMRNHRQAQRAIAEVDRLEVLWRENPVPDTAMPLLVAMRAAGAFRRRMTAIVEATGQTDDFADARLVS